MIIILLVIGLPIAALIIQLKKESKIREKIFKVIMILYFLKSHFFNI